MALNTASTSLHEAASALKTKASIRIGFISEYDPRDRNQFSGTIHYMFRALTECPGLDVSMIGDNSVIAAVRHLRSFARNTSVLNPIDKPLFAVFTRYIEKQLEKKTCDILIAPVASEIIANLSYPKTLPPILFLTDATPSYLREEYGTQIDGFTEQREREVFLRCTKIVYSSDYMARRALTEFPDIFQGNGDKVNVIPFGLNIDDVPAFVAPKNIGDMIELLFIGKNWHRKGGDVAVAATQYLQQQGLKVRLTVVGSAPPVQPSTNVEVVSFIDKNIPEQKAKFLALHQKSTFLILPTLADCTPMVIAEANAFGTPVLVSDVGGIRTLVADERNGVLLRPGATGEAYARRIMKYLYQPDAYRQMSIEARQAYEERLNWTVWANRIKALALEVLNSPPPPSDVSNERYT